MAERQGGAEVKLRGEAIAIIADARIMGRQSHDGVWHGEDITDWAAFCERRSVDDSEDSLGAALRECLLRSRLMSAEWANAQRQAADYDARLATLFGLSSTRRLYPGMKDVSVDWTMEQVTFIPTRHRRGSAFEGFELGADRGHQAIVVPFASSDAEFGAALRLAIERCL